MDREEILIEVKDELF